MCPGTKMMSDIEIFSIYLFVCYVFVIVNDVSIVEEIRDYVRQQQ